MSSVHKESFGQDIRLGEIRIFNGSLHDMRVVGLDSIEVHYETLDPLYAKLYKDSSFYCRTPPRFILTESRRVRLSDFTEEERKKYRPDLPLRICRCRSLNWTDLVGANESAVMEILSRASVDVSKEPALATMEVALYPLLKNGFAKKPKQLRCRNPQGFNLPEILVHASQVRASCKSALEPTEGLGLFRLGFVKGHVPSYYIGGFYDIGGSIAYYEKQ